MFVFLRDMERNLFMKDYHQWVMQRYEQWVIHRYEQWFGIIRTDIPDRYSGQIFRTDIPDTTNLVYLYQEMGGTLSHRSKRNLRLFSFAYVFDSSLKRKDLERNLLNGFVYPYKYNILNKPPCGRLYGPEGAEGAEGPVLSNNP
jgi:hypothetical protein